MADDYGNFRANTKQLDGAVFWARESLASVSVLLEELSGSGLISLYRVRGQPYGHLNGWEKHQKVDHPSKPRCPGPSEADAVIEKSDEPGLSNAVGSRKSRETIARPSLLTRTTTSTTDQDQDQDRVEIPNTAPVQAVLSVVDTKPTSVRKRDSRLADANEVFAVWAKHRKVRHPRGPEPKLDEDRTEVIRARLSDGFDVETLKLAVEGVWRDAWHLGQNDRGTEYCDIRHALKDAPAVERFAELTITARGMSKPAPKESESATIESAKRLPEAG